MTTPDLNYTPEMEYLNKERPAFENDVYHIVEFFAMSGPSFLKNEIFFN